LSSVSPYLFIFHSAPKMI